MQTLVTLRFLLRLDCAAGSCNFVRMKTTEFIAKRHDLGLTQEQLAHRIGITVRQMVRIEGRDTVPRKYALAIVGLETEIRLERA